MIVREQSRREVQKVETEQYKFVSCKAYTQTYNAYIVYVLHITYSTLYIHI